MSFMFNKKLRLIALNEPYSGKLHGIRGADFECKRQATKANIKGSFRSFLASGGQNLADLVRPSAAHKSSIVNLRVSFKGAPQIPVLNCFSTSIQRSN